MLKVGLTGGIASGKSVVGEMFVALGAHLIQADRIAHQLMQPGQLVYNEVVRHFGREILDPDGSVNRAKLAEAAFGAGSKPAEGRLPRIKELNRIVHFAARQKIDVEAARQEVTRRMSAQLPDEEKIKAADYVIDNSGSLEQTRAQVSEVWEKLRAEATGKR